MADGPTPIVVYGAGGVAREMVWLLRRINAAHSTGPRWDCRGFVVTDRSRGGTYDSTEEIIGEEDWLDAHPQASVVIGIGSGSVRERIGRRLLERLGEGRLPSLIDPSAIYDEATCRFGPGSILAAGSVMTVNVELEPFALIGVNCCIGHEARHGFGSVVNPGAAISGGVELGAGCLVGTGAQVLQYLRVGEGATVGAGAVVTRDVPDQTVVVGVPARPQT